MTEKIYQKLLEKLGKTSLSERTVKTYAGQLAKTVTKDEELTDDVIASAVEILKALGGQYDHDLADAIKKNPPKPEPTKPEPTKPEPPKPDEPFKDYEKRIAELEKKSREQEERYEREIKAVKLKNISDAVKKQLQSSGCTNSLVLELAFAKSNIDAEKSVDDNAKSVRDLYDSLFKENLESGMIPRSAEIRVATISQEDREKKAKEDMERLKEKMSN
jgi:hypothetical protein